MRSSKAALCHQPKFYKEIDLIPFCNEYSADQTNIQTVKSSSALVFYFSSVTTNPTLIAQAKKRFGCFEDLLHCQEEGPVKHQVGC